MALLLYRLPSFSLSSSQLIYKQQQQQQQQNLQQRLIISDCSANNNTRVKTTTTTTTRKSNSQLCTELREFVSLLGFPQGYVPSYKELSDHGRKDLAYIVRRRGYKLITKLLTNSTQLETDTDTSSAENDLVVGLDKELTELAQNWLLSTDASNKGKLSIENGVPPIVSSAETCGLIESRTSLSLVEKASKFIKDGELDNIQDNDLVIGCDTSSSNSIGEEIESDSAFGQSSINGVCGNNETSVLHAPPLETQSDDFSSAEGFNNAHAQKDLDGQTGTRDNEHEINRLKVMLHQKELELYQLKEQIEKEKLALSTLQAKAENEIGKAQKIISSKDEELHIAEGNLSGLKEVQLDYCGHGETVEVAGSFNGWHHRIKMESQPLSTSARPTELRKSRDWSTVLWLYPGIYEIKFVVDGHWMIDPQRESSNRGTIHNNVLRVDR